MHTRPSVSPFVSLAIAVLTLGAPAAASDPPDLDRLSWLVGYWVGRTERVEMEEIWIEPKGGVMLGLHRDSAPGRPAFFEYLRIEEREGRVVFVASPRGTGSTEFALVRFDGQHAVFENREHDYPQRIIYRRSGERLTARIEGEIGGKLDSSEWVWELVE